MAELDVPATMSALDGWLTSVATRFPWRARVLRFIARSPFWCSCLIRAIVRHG